MSAVSDEERDFDRVVDSNNRGWLRTGDDLWRCFDSSTTTARPAAVDVGFGTVQPAPRPLMLSERPLSEVEREFGPVRPVLPLTAADADEIRAALELAGRKAVASVASAVEQVHSEARRDIDPPGTFTSESSAYAKRTLVAGRPGSWEAEALLELVFFGNSLNLYPYKSGGDVDKMRETGPNPKRVHLEARDRIAAVLRRWVESPDRYTEVPENLAALVSGFADTTYGADGWRQIADQWLQPKSLDQQGFSDCYGLLYSQSAHFDPALRA